jgi:subtilisin-like proprotein convertase family protein
MNNQALARLLQSLLCGVASLGLMHPILLRAATNSFQGTNSAQTTINDNAASFAFTNATPYPSTINVSGLTGEVSHVSVTLWGLHHTSSADISVLLVPPDGTNGVVLMSQAGGQDTGDPPVGTVSVSQLTFDDNAPTNLYTTGTWWPITNGTYLPTDGAVTNYFLPPAPPGLFSTSYSNYSTTLSGLNGALPNGTWSLYIQDESPGDDGVITNGWSLSITTSLRISVTPPVLSAGLDSSKTAFMLAIPTVKGVTYVAEYADVLPTTNWTRLSTVAGDGTVQVVTDPILTNQSRFYRTRTPP